MAEVTYISYSARAKSTTADGIFAEAQQILDISKNKNQQAINAEVTTELGKKLAKTDFDSFKSSNTNAIAAKADKSYVDTQLNKKVDASNLEESMDRMQAGVDKKADKTYVDTELGKKANSADVYTKSQTDSAITAKVNAAVSSVYRVKGTKATIGEVTALTNVKCGDVWNVTAEFTLGGKKYPAGTNVVALADKSAADAANWDALGGTVDMAGHTQEMKTWANGQFAGKAYETKVNTNTTNIGNLTTRVGAVETKASTNANNITSLTSRVSTAEGKITANTNKFANYYTKGETDTKLGTKANSADVYKKSEVYTKEEADDAASYNAHLALKLNRVFDINSVVEGKTIEQTSLSSHSGTLVLVLGAPGMGSLKQSQLCLFSGGKYYGNWAKTTAETTAISNGYFLRTPDGSVYTQSGNTKAEACVVDAAKLVSNVYTKGEVDSKLSLKANSADVYNKSQVDSKFTATNNNVSSLTTRVGAVEGKFSGYVPMATYNALIERVTALENLLKLA